MSEAAKRHSTRPKKPSKFRQMVDSEYGNFNQPKGNESRDPLSCAQENNQLAKILVKFLNSANQKTKDLLKGAPIHCPAPQLLTLSDRPRSQPPKPQEPPSRQQQSQALLSARNGDHKFVQPSKGNSKGQGKGGDFSKKGTNSFPPSIENDLSYHAMLGQHIRSSLPDSRNISPEMLMQLGLPPRETFDLSQGKNPERKKRVENKSGQIRQERKPFKRQSYHVAIAYHIYLKQIKGGSNPSARDIDPTYHARKLREQTQKQP